MQNAVIDADYQYSTDCDDNDRVTLSQEPLYAAELEGIEDLTSFLSNEADKNATVSATLINRVAKLLAWINETLYSTDTYTPVIELVYYFVKQKYRIMGKYYLHLANVFRYKASTVLNHIDDLNCFFNWFVVYRSDDAYPLTSPDLHNLYTVQKHLRKKYSKKRKHERAETPNTIEDLITARAWPANGISDLYEAVKKEKDEWLDNVLLKKVSVCKGTYIPMLELLASSFYTTSVQGRVSAFNMLQMKNIPEMLNQGVAFSKEFKTSSTFGLQPVILSDTSRYLLRVYLDVFRPKQYGSRPCDLLFISFEGKPVSFGKLVVRFFKRTLNLHITTTRIRAIVETATEELHSIGGISQADRTSVSNISGHNHATATKFYVKKTRMNDVQHSTSVFNKILPTQLSDSMSYEEDLSTHSVMKTFADLEKNKDDAVVAIAGCEHKSFESNMRRVPWSEFEISYVGNWCTKNKDLFNVVAHCLKEIYSTPSVLTKFHPRHIENSARLRHAWDFYQARPDE